MERFQNSIRIGGKLYAPTLPGYLAGAPHAPKDSVVRAFHRGCFTEGAWKTIRSLAGIDDPCSVDSWTLHFGDYGYSTLNKRNGYPSQCSRYWPVFVPLNEHGEFEPVPDNLTPREFCSLELVLNGEKKQVPVQNKRLTAYHGEDIVFCDPVMTSKFNIRVVAVEGVLVPTRPVLTNISLEELYYHGLVQRAVDTHGGRVVAYIDGDPFEVKLPDSVNFASDVNVFLRENIPYLCAGKVPDGVKNGSFPLKNGSLPMLPVDACVKCAVFEGHACIMYSNKSDELWFAPLFVPLDPVTLNHDPSYLDDIGLAKGECGCFGSFLVDGAPVSFASDCQGYLGFASGCLAYRGQSLTFGDTVVEKENRIPVVRVENCLMATVPLMCGVSFSDCVRFGFVPET